MENGKLKVGDILGYSRTYIEKEKLQLVRKLGKIPRKLKKRIISNHIKNLKSEIYEIVSINKW